MSATTIQDKVIVIGGGTMARHYAANGARTIIVHYNSDVTRAAAEETVAAVQAAGALALALAVQGHLIKVKRSHICSTKQSKPLDALISPSTRPVW